VRLGDTTAAAQSDLGAALMALGRADAALGHFRRATALAPEDEVLHFNLGTTLSALSRTAEAEAAFRRALALNPDYVDAHVNLGVSLLGRRRVDEALTHFQRAAALRPDSVSMQSNLGGALMGLGMVFFGLETMKDGFAPLKDMPVFVEAFAWFEASSYLGVMKCVVVGCLLTLLVQSSSATLGVTIGLAVTGVIPFTTAAALVLGENIGTTITVIIAQFGATTAAKRAAWAHVLFNVIGVFWITLIFQWYMGVVSQVVERSHGQNPLTYTFAGATDQELFAVVITSAIALTHTGFNVLNTLLFLPFLTPYTKLLTRLVLDPRVKEVAKLKHIDPRTVSAPVLGIEQSRGEVVQMGESVVAMNDGVRQLGFHGPVDERLIQQTFHREEVLDNSHRDIVRFLTDLLDATMPHAIAAEGRRQLRMAHECESASDRLASVLKAFLRLREHRLELPADLKGDLLDLHDTVAGLFRQVIEAFSERRVVDDAEAQSANALILSKVKTLRDRQLKLMTDHPVNPALSLVFNGILTDYSRIRAHAMNLHEASVETSEPS